MAACSTRATARAAVPQPPPALGHSAVAPARCRHAAAARRRCRCAAAPLASQLATSVAERYSATSLASQPATSVAERYAALFARGASGGCPPLFLAPMEGLADRPFRRALASTIGGFDEACTEFIRIPGAAPDTLPQMLKAAARLTEGAYDAGELGATPLAAQLMGSVPEFLGAAAAHLAGPLRAHRVDLNCGCPANTVTGRGAGSSLLREPTVLRSCVAALAAGVAGSGAVVTVKLRAGFDDTSLFERNLEAALDAGAAFVTLHPRTRAQGYSGAADWALIARAVTCAAGVPVVGNGDVTSAQRALALLEQSRCAGVMVGRGAATDPLIFRRIRAACGAGAAPAPSEEPALVEAFLRRYYAELALVPPPRAATHRGGRSDAEAARFRVGKLKQLSNYLLRGSAAMATPLAALLRRGADGSSADAAAHAGLAHADAMLEDIVACVREHWAGAPRSVLVDNFSSRAALGGVTQRVLPLHADVAIGNGCSCGGEMAAAEEVAPERSMEDVVARALAQRRRREAREAAWRARKAKTRAATAAGAAAAPV